MLAAGPVVALNRGSVPEVVVDGLTGFVRDAPSGLATAIGDAGGIDPATCRRHVEENFDASTMAGGYERVYTAVLAAGPNGQDVACLSR